MLIKVYQPHINNKGTGFVSYYLIQCRIETARLDQKPLISNVASELLTRITISL